MQTLSAATFRQVVDLPVARGLDSIRAPRRDIGTVGTLRRILVGTLTGTLDRTAFLSVRSRLSIFNCQLFCRQMAVGATLRLQTRLA